jgi:hypothetical protein
MRGRGLDFFSDSHVPPFLALYFYNKKQRKTYYFKSYGLDLRMASVVPGMFSKAWPLAVSNQIALCVILNL